MKRKYILGLIVLSTFIFVSICFAQPGYFKRQGKKGHNKRDQQRQFQDRANGQQQANKRKEFLKNLNLSEEQKQAFKDLRSKRFDMDRLKIDVQETKANLAELVSDSKVSEKEIREAFDKSMAAHERLAKAHVDNLLELRKVFDEKQMKFVMHMIKMKMQGQKGAGGAGFRGGPRGGQQFGLGQRRGGHPGAGPQAGPHPGGFGNP